MATRAGAILAVADVGRSVEFYRDRIGFEVEALYDDPPYAEVGDARAEHRRLAETGVRFLAEPHEPPWGGCRFFCVDPDGYLVEIEQPAP
jgi:catechol 2,3-dioxygenase-like lactoylglutathione lyase family enzyme